jgi:hypothetical protein
MFMRYQAPPADNILLNGKVLQFLAMAQPASSDSDAHAASSIYSLLLVLQIQCESAELQIRVSHEASFLQVRAGISKAIPYA